MNRQQHRKQLHQNDEHTEPHLNIDSVVTIINLIIIITVFIQRLTHRRLVYNGITQV